MCPYMAKSFKSNICTLYNGSVLPMFLSDPGFITLLSVDLVLVSWLYLSILSHVLGLAIGGWRSLC